ncbi:MAG: tRNA guanosine(34) transglycosylase Tgt [Deltaproteobacteria bacterium]|nr:tRNA guanosine(34) transglycosylase Tgt [Deltaproteobacteria bacterium]
MLIDKSPFFRVLKNDPQSAARTGEITTQHGTILTPAFMPVGTRGSVKAVDPTDLLKCGSQIVLANAYHLTQRPGLETLRLFGGLHKFMGWSGPILTDSGGYQVFSLAALRKIEPEGVTFHSPYDGSVTFFSPQSVVAAQTVIGSDIMMCLDECPPYPADYAPVAKSLALTLDWAAKSRAAWDPNSGQALFGIVQGGFYPDLRAQAAAAIAAMDFPGHSLGGLALGEPEAERLQAIETAREILPKDKPLYLMGLGTPNDLIQGVLRGADLFDCVLPTRNARNGQLFTRFGRLNLLNSRHKEDPNPPDPACQCLTCQTFSRAYLRHLLKNREPLFSRLATIHNLTYYHDLLAGVRSAIKTETLAQYVLDFYAAQKAQDSPD